MNIYNPLSSSSPPLNKPRLPAVMLQKYIRVACAFIALSVSTGSIAVAPYLRSDRSIKDEQGRVEVIVDFLDDAHLSYPDRPLSREAQTARFTHVPQAVLLVEDFERVHGFQRTGMTSWVGNSVTAFLTVEQIERLLVEKAVKQISDNTTHTFSALPVWRSPDWGNSSVGNEWKSWGHQTVFGPGVTHAAGSSSLVVYLIDSGVADHTDLNMHPVYPRVNVACGSTGDCDTVGTAAEQAQYSVVGCYAHATHVAGIIGAKENEAGTVGVYSGVTLRSVSVIKASAPYTEGVGSPIGGNVNSKGWCANLSLKDSQPPPAPDVIYPPTSATIGFALDWIYNRILFDNVGVGIVNMSINPGGVGYAKNSVGVFTPEPNNPKMKKLATPAFYGLGQYYSGAFIAQSAGNDAQNACRHCGGTGTVYDLCQCNQAGCEYGGSQAFRPNATETTDPNDGIMVVGAHHHTGEAVTTTLPFSPSYPAVVSPEAANASNFGACVDAWAPGNAIVSSWGIQQNTAVGAQTVVGSQYLGNVNQSTTGWLFLSGTSMAAPHIAGAAAFLADAFNLTTPAQIENKLRTYFLSYGNDPASLPVNTVQIQ